MMGNSSNKEDSIPEILFGKKFVNFDEDGFKGTKKEYKIYEEAAFKNSMEDANANASNVNQISSDQDLPHESENASLRKSSALVSFEENSSCCTRCGISCRDFFSVQERFSVLKLNRQENEVPELSNSTFSLDAHSKALVPVLDLPEKHKGDVNATETKGDNEGANVSEVQHREVEVGNQMKLVAPLISEENTATKETSNAIVCANQCLDAPISVDNSNTTVRTNKPLKREVHSRLESCAHSLLVDAGWIVEVRQRTARIKPAYYFRNLEAGLNCKALNLAWVSCGKILSASASESERDEKGREWFGIHSFMEDMNAALDYIGEEARRGSSISLLKRWRLLDPFMAVAWIDKKLSVLRAGIGLKAVNSMTFMIDNVTDRADNNDGEASTSLGKKRKIPCRSESNFTSMQKESSCLEEHKNIPDTEVTVNLITVENGRENIMRSEMSSPNQAVKHEVNIVASPVCNLICKSVYKESASLPQENLSTAVKMTCSNKTKSKLKREAADDSSKKTIKKSKKIFDCDATGTDYSASDIIVKEANIVSGPNSKSLPNLSVDKSDNVTDNSLKIEKLEILTETLRKKENKDENVDTLYERSIKPDNGETKRRSPNESSWIDSKKKELAHDQCVDPRIVESANDKSISKESKDECAFDDALVNSNDISCDKSVVSKKSKEKKIYRGRINDDDLLISLILKSKCRKARAKNLSSDGESNQSKESRKSKSQTANRTLLPRDYKKEAINSLGERTILSWLIENGALSVKDVIQFRNLENDEVVKDGRVTLKGILCKCCANLFSVSEFRAHANVKQQKTSLNLYLKSGKTYIECQLQAWSTEYKRRKGSIRIIGDDEKAEGDDTCGICGDVGDLICCDNCPSTYHKSCLCIKEVPEGNWYCWYCICAICNVPVLETEISSSLSMLECFQCQLKYHGTCIEKKVGWNGKLGSGAWLCGKSCRKVYYGLRSLIGVVNQIDDGHSWTVLKCNHGSRKIGSAEKVALTAECNAKLALALTLMEECFLPMVDPKTGISMIPHVVYNFGSPFRRLNYQGFYTVVLEKGDVLISVAAIRVHGDEVAEMPLVVSCYQYRRQGMCRRLLNCVEKMLISLNVKMLLISAIPSLVDTWVSSFGFKPVEAEDRQQLAKLNLMPFPDTTLLKKKLQGASALEPVESIDCGSSEQQFPDCSESIESASAAAINQATENDEVSTNAGGNIDILQIEASVCAKRDFGNKIELSSSIKFPSSKEMNNVLTSQKISISDEGVAVNPMNCVQNVRFEDKNARNILIDDLREKNAEILPNGIADKDEISDACHATTCNMEEKASDKSIFLLRVVKGVYLS